MTVPTESAARRGLLFLSAATTALGERPDDLALTARLTIATALAADLAPPVRSRAEKTLREIRSAGASAAARWNGGSAGRPGLHWLLAAAVEQRVLGAASPHLTGYAERVAELLADDDTPATVPTRLALRCLGMAGPVPGGVALDLQPEELLGRPDEVDRVCDRIELATRFGGNPVSASPHLHRALAAVLYCALQDYRLIAAARILRCLTYLDGDPIAVRDAGAFLINQQEEEGNIGFLDREAAEAEERRPGFGALELKIETTLTAFWALAESAPGSYRLFRDLGCSWPRSQVAC